MMYMVGVCCNVVVSSLFFFFKQKTAYEMRISDWSSDVCSSDLNFVHGCSLQRMSNATCIAMGSDDGAGNVFPVRGRQPIGIRMARSEERRVGKASGSTCRSRWEQTH